MIAHQNVAVKQRLNLKAQAGEMKRREDQGGESASPTKLYCPMFINKLVRRFMVRMFWLV